MNPKSFTLLISQNRHRNFLRKICHKNASEIIGCLSITKISLPNQKVVVRVPIMYRIA